MSVSLVPSTFTKHGPDLTPDYECDYCGKEFFWPEGQEPAEDQGTWVCLSCKRVFVKSREDDGMDPSETGRDELERALRVVGADEEEG